MATDQFSTNAPEAIWWRQQHQLPLMDDQTPKTQSSTFTIFRSNSHCNTNPQFQYHRRLYQTPIAFPAGQMIDDGRNLSPEERDHEEAIPKEPMFEKPLTPSDVGKLNRLVIPKQHAERHFPLGGSGSGSEPAADKGGVLLSFEDESGKPWRFRYSYWNSSQSYVLTKGWSRFVKEKRLDAGDVVSFERHRVNVGRLFIGWRRRTAAQADESAVGGDADGDGGSSRVMYTTDHHHHHKPYPWHTDGPHPFPYQLADHCSFHAGTVVEKQTAKRTSKRRLRLFGVNLECPLPEDSFTCTAEDIH